jgi:hypothetical protein
MSSASFARLAIGVVAIGWASAAGPAAAQPSQSGPAIERAAYPDKNYGVFVNPLGLLAGSLNVEIAFAINEKAAFTVGGAFAQAGVRIGSEGLSATAYGGQVGLLIYPQERVFNRFYVNPFAVGMRAHIKDGSLTSEATLVGGGAIAGYHWTWNGGFSLRLGGGLAYVHAVATSGDAEIVFAGVGPALEGALGWTW